MKTAWLVLGMILLAVGAQGAIRLLADHDDAGLLSWIPGGFGVQLVVYLLAVLVGVWLAASKGQASTQRSVK